MTIETLATNPFKEARLSIIDPDTNRSISHAVLAKRMGVSKTALIHMEHGFFPEPLPKVLAFLANRGFSELSLTDGYYNFQYQTRISHPRYFGDHLEVDVYSVVHPLDQLHARSPGYVSLTQMCKDLCLPQSDIAKFIKNTKQQSIPKIFLATLMQIGYPEHEINLISSQYLSWRLSRKGQ